MRGAGSFLPEQRQNLDTDSLTTTADLVDLIDVLSTF